MDDALQITMLAIPAFVVLMAIEFLAYYREHRHQHDAAPAGKRPTVGVSGRDTASSLSVYAIGRVVKPLGKLIELPIVAAAGALTPLALSSSHWWTWLLALVLADLAYYAKHRIRIVFDCSGRHTACITPVSGSTSPPR